MSLPETARWEYNHQVEEGSLTRTRTRTLTPALALALTLTLALTLNPTPNQVEEGSPEAEIMDAFKNPREWA